MNIFISWSGERGHQIADAFKRLLVTVIPSIEEQNVFISSEMEKGILWSTQIVQELKRSDAGIICLTPERLNSTWLHFEAGALIHHLTATASDTKNSDDLNFKHPGIFTYLHQVNPAQISGPLSAYQSTTTKQDDTWVLVKSIAGISGQKLEGFNWLEQFKEAWVQFEKVLRNITVTIPQLIPEFENWFRRKTFNEPLQQCTAQSWLDRYNGARDTYLKLKNNHALVESACTTYQIDLYEVLQTQADAYVMNLELLLKAEPFRMTEKGDVDIQPPGILHACEMRRKAVKDVVSKILDPLNIPKTDDAVRFTECETFAQKKLLVHRKEHKIRTEKERLLNNGSSDNNKHVIKDLAGSELLENYLFSPWDLDRIYYYLLKENFEMPSEEHLDSAADAVRLEIEKLGSQTGNISLMPLSYSLRAMQGVIPALDPVSSELLKKVKGLMDEISKFIATGPKTIDTDHQINNSIEKIKRRLNRIDPDENKVYDPNS